MSDGENCGNCQFGRFKAGSRAGMCVARPPTPIVVGKGTNLMGQEVPAVDGFFAPVTPTTWCGAYRRENRNGAAGMDERTLVDTQPEGNA